MSTGEMFSIVVLVYLIIALSVIAWYKEPYSNLRDLKVDPQNAGFKMLTYSSLWPVFLVLVVILILKGILIAFWNAALGK